MWDLFWPPACPATVSLPNFAPGIGFCSLSGIPPEQFLDPSCQRAYIVVIQIYKSEYSRLFRPLWHDLVRVTGLYHIIINTSVSFLKHSGYNLKVVRLIGHVMSVYGQRSCQSRILVLWLFVCVFRNIKNLAYLNFILNVIDINIIICKFN
jgi:hypothetical protein